jgi:hypothetical protein
MLWVVTKVVITIRAAPLLRRLFFRHFKELLEDVEAQYSVLISEGEIGG